MAGFQRPDDSPLLTEKQWLAFMGLSDRGEKTDSPEGLSDPQRRSYKSKGRSRLRDSLIGFRHVLNEIDVDDRKHIFEVLDDFREQREEERELLQGWDPPEGEGRREMFGVDESVDAERGEALYQGIVSLLAVLYNGVEDRVEFEHMVERGIFEARKDRGYLPADIQVNITIEGPEQYDRTELIDRVRSGDIEREELETLLRNDPVAIFEGGLLEGDENE